MCSDLQHRNLRRAFTPLDLFWLLLLLALLISILLPSLSRARELAKRAVCASNLRGCGQGMLIYANDNEEWFPTHYFEATYGSGDALPRTHGVTWVGTMGSNAELKISESTSSTKSPKRNHPSRSLFMLVINGITTPNMYFCPAGSDEPDDLRNSGPDAGGAADTIAAQPGRNRFDFAGYDRLSYGYQLPYGPQARPHANLDSRMVIAADKGPYYRAAGAGLAESRTTRDGRSDLAAPAGWSDVDPARLVSEVERWRPFNSRNHRGEGQNVMFLDTHVEFAKTPAVGVNRDNVFTIQTSLDERIAGIIGSVPESDEALGPATKTDSFIVP